MEVKRMYVTYWRKKSYLDRDPKMHENRAEIMVIHSYKSFRVKLQCTHPTNRPTQRILSKFGSKLSTTKPNLISPLHNIQIPGMRAKMSLDIINDKLNG